MHTTTATPSVEAPEPDVEPQVPAACQIVVPVSYSVYQSLSRLAGSLGIPIEVLAERALARRQSLLSGDDNYI